MKNLITTLKFTAQLIAFSFVTSGTSTLQAQICGTTSHSKELINVKSVKDDYTVKLVVWTVGTDEGTGKYGAEEISKVLTSSLPKFEEHGIHFELCNSLTMNNTYYLDNPDALVYSETNQEFYKEGYINYYLINSDFSNHSEGSAGRKGSQNRAWGFYSDDLPSFIFSHEIGHVLGLNHTFFLGGGCDQFCSASGDFVCDTAPDPYKTQTDQSVDAVGYKIVAPCNFVNVNNLRTSCGELITDEGYEVPIAQNVMSYYLSHECGNMKRFSEGQGLRMRSTLETMSNVVLDLDNGEVDELCDTKRNIIWEDTNGNGFQEADESGIANVSVNLVDPISNAVIANTVSDDQGFYDFKDLNEGEYVLHFEQPENLIPTFPNLFYDAVDSDLNLSGHTDIIKITSNKKLDIDAGFMVPSAIAGKAWIDNSGDEDDVYDDQDQLLKGIQVNLIEETTGELAMSTMTDENGKYSFTICPGNYSLDFEKKPGYIPVNNNIGSDDIDSDISPNSFRTEIIELQIAQKLDHIDGGFYFDVVLASSTTSLSSQYHQDENIIQINWSNENLKDIEYFEIERSINQLDEFEYLGTIGTDDYRFEFNDENINTTGIYYYRIKEVHFDGTVEYSKILQEEVRLINEAKLKIYPNPTPDYLHIEAKDLEEDMTARIMDASGKILLQRNITASFGQSIETINLDFLTSGIYFVNLEGESHSETQRIIKQ